MIKQLKRKHPRKRQTKPAMLKASNTVIWKYIMLTNSLNPTQDESDMKLLNCLTYETKRKIFSQQRDGCRALFSRHYLISI